MSLVLATSRRWNEVLKDRLASRLGQDFHLITRTEQMTVPHLESIGAETVFLPHWSHIIPKEVHERFECIIFHMTDLPYGRGGSPLQNLIVRGHKNTKLTALKCVNGLDSGPIYMKREMSLEGSAEEIFYRMRDLVEEMVCQIVRERPVPIEQVGEIVSFKRRTPEQGDLCSATTSDQIYDLIRMLDAEGYPHAYVDIGPFRAEFTKAFLEGREVSAHVRIVERKE